MAETQGTRQKWAAGATTTPTPDQATVKGKIVEFLWWMLKEGYDEETARVRAYLMKRMVNLGANLEQPETIKNILAKQKWGNGYKANIVDAYSCFLRMNGKSWEPPDYQRSETLAFIPTSEEIDQLISAASRMTGAFLQGLKDTGADPGELGAIEWIDVNKEARTVMIKHPVKGHKARVLQVSENFIDRLAVLPKRAERIFNYENVKRNFYKQRLTIARKLGNPRILKISFITFRHWKGTMEYHRTKDILYVQRLLGHKTLQSTLVYIDYEKAVFGSPDLDEFTVRVAANVKEACELVESGFEYVTGEYSDGGKIFRKRK